MTYKFKGQGLFIQGRSRFPSMANFKSPPNAPKKSTKAIDKSTAQRIAETLLLFAPAPIRAIASTPLGSKIFLTALTGLLTTGALSVDWEGGVPKIQWNREKLPDAKEQVTQDLHQQGIQWQQTSNGGPTVSYNGQQYPVPVQSLPGFQQQNQGFPQHQVPQQGLPQQGLPQQGLPQQGQWYPPSQVNLPPPPPGGGFYPQAPQQQSPNPYAPQPGYVLPPGYAPPPGFATPPGYSPPPGYTAPPGYNAPPGYTAPPGAYSAGPGPVYPPGYVR